MNRFFRTRRGGYSLIEVVLALALGALVLSSLTACFVVSRRQWKKVQYQSQILQHLRIALDRICTELRYADTLTSVGTSVLGFTTTNLINDTPDIETIQYSRDMATMSILRNVSTVPGAWEILAGTPTLNTPEVVYVGAMNTSAYKLDASNYLVPLDVADPLSLAVAVKLRVEVAGTEGESLNIETLVKLRNK